MPDVSNTLTHNTSRTRATADDRANRSAFTAAGNRADDCANARRSTDFRGVVLGRITTFYATFRVNLWFVVGAHRRYLHQLGMKLRRAIVGCANLIESKLELSDALHFAGSPDLCDVPVDDVTGVLGRPDNAGLNPVATLAGVGGNRRKQLERENGVAWN